MSIQCLSILCSHLLQLAKKDGNPLDFEFVEHHKVKNPPKTLLPLLIFSMKLFFHDILCIPLSRLQHSHSLLSARRVYGTSMASSFKLINFQLKYFVGLLTYLLVALKLKVAESLHIDYVGSTLTHVGSSHKCSTFGGSDTYF